MADELLTTLDVARAKLAAAQEKRRAAARREAVLLRELAATDRKLRAARLLAVGAAVWRWAENDERFRAALMRGLPGYITRETDRGALRDTILALPEGDGAASPPAASQTGA